MNSYPIGVFDSGVGGLSIYHSLKKYFPTEYFIYLADQQNCPYGIKSEAEINKLVFKNCLFLKQKKCKIIIIACNTATTAAIDLLRLNFRQMPFIGIVPPIKPLAEQSETGHFIILSTPATQKSLKLKLLIEKFSVGKKVYNFSLPGAVELIEKGKIHSAALNKILQKSLKPVLKDKKVDIIGLGCTHYFFIIKELKKIFKREIKIIIPNFGVCRQVKRILQKNNQLNKVGKTKPDIFFTTGNPDLFTESAGRLMGMKIKAKKV